MLVNISTLSLVSLSDFSRKAEHKQGQILKELTEENL